LLVAAPALAIALAPAPSAAQLPATTNSFECLRMNDMCVTSLFVGFAISENLSLAPEWSPSQIRRRPLRAPCQRKVSCV
jgi:hypothetical protein